MIEKVLTGRLAIVLAAFWWSVSGAHAMDLTVPLNEEWTAPDITSCMPGRNVDPGEAAEAIEAARVLQYFNPYAEHFRRLIRLPGLSICLDADSVGVRGFYEPERRRVGVVVGLTPSEKILIMAHELHHADQYLRGYDLALNVDLDEYVRHIFAVEADSQAFTYTLAWAMRENGYPGVWAAALKMSHYEDIAARVARNATAAPGDTRGIMLSAFRAWYGSEWRTGRYFMSSASNYLDRIDETKAIRRYDKFEPDHFDWLCLLPETAINYGCHLTPEISRPPR